jgi:hypothetical protein
MRAHHVQEPETRPAAAARHLLPAVLVVASAVLLALAGRDVRAYRPGPPPDRVGACGFGLTCRDGGCHSTFSEGSTTLTHDVRIEAPAPGPLPPAYVPGRAYDLRLELRDTDPVALVWGFELATLLECLPGPRMAGALEALEPGRTRVFPGADAITFLSHRCTCGTEDPSCCGYVPPSIPGEIGWTFRWTAPSRGSGPVTFAFAVNAANWDGTPIGDRISRAEVTWPEEACPDVVVDLRVRVAGCDPTQPGVPHVELTWTPTGTADVIRTTTDVSALALPREQWDLLPSSCTDLRPAPLTFYSVAGTCELGDEGPH